MTTKQIQDWQPINVPKEVKRKVKALAGLLRPPVAMCKLIDEMTDERAKREGIKIPK